VDGTGGKFDEIHCLLDKYPEPFDLKSFRRYAASQYFEDQLDVWLALNTYKLLGNDELKDRAEEIIRLYLQEGAEKQANISSHLKNRVLRDVREWTMEDPREVFQKVQDDIFQMLHDCLWSFYGQTLSSVSVELSKKEALWWKDPHITFAKFFTFPNPVFLPESRMHGALSFLLFAISVSINYYYDFPYIWWYLAYGYIARTLCGPRLDTQAWFVLFVCSPLFLQKGRLFKPKLTPGPPRRMAQFLGSTMTTAGVIFYHFGYRWLAYIMFSMMIAVGGLFAFCDICFGCMFFALLMKLGLIPEDICVLCRVTYVGVRVHGK
jgi:hypothetical protein